MIAPFRRIRAKDPDLKSVQDAVAFVFQDITPKEILDGRVIKNVSLNSSTATVVEHGLGRAPIGYIGIKANAPANIYDTQDSNPSPSATLQLKADAAVTVSLWVF